MKKSVTSFFALTAFILFNTLGAQNSNPNQLTPSWRQLAETIFQQIDASVTSSSNMTAGELYLFQNTYRQQIFSEKEIILNAVRAGNLDDSNVQSYTNAELLKCLDLVKQFRKENPNASNYSLSNTLSIINDDTIRPIIGAAQAPNSNMGFEDGTMNHWMACGAAQTNVAPDAIYPGSPAWPYGFLNYKLSSVKGNLMKADCYGPTGNLTKAADCFNYLGGAVNTPPYTDSYQLRVFNAGDKDSLDPSCPAVYPGMTNSVMVGDYCGVSLGAAILQQKFSVTQSNSALAFMYALFLQNPGHGAGQQPTFQVVLLDEQGDTIPGFKNYFFDASTNLSSWKKVGMKNYQNYKGDTMYEKTWTAEFVSLKKYIGQDVVLQFISRDCAQGAHAGYAYVDAKSGPLKIEISGCVSATRTLTAPIGASAYKWIGAGIVGVDTSRVVTVTSSGIYKVILKSNKFISVTDTLITTVDVSAPSIGLSVNVTPAICGQTNGVASVSVDGGTPGYSYSWSALSGASGATADNIAAGTYTITVADANSCSATTVATINCVTGIEKNKVADSFTISPNPSDGTFLIEGTLKKTERTTISLSTILGETTLIIDDYIPAGQYRKQVMMEQLAPGIYFLQVRQDDELRIRKIIKR